MKYCILLFYISYPKKNIIYGPSWDKFLAPPLHSWCSSLSLELLGKSLWSLGSIPNLCLTYLRRCLSSDLDYSRSRPKPKTQLYNLDPWPHITYTLIFTTFYYYYTLYSYLSIWPLYLTNEFKSSVSLFLLYSILHQ